MSLKYIEHTIEKCLYASRWLMAPLYVGLIGGLVILLATFFRELYASAAMLFTDASPSDMVVSVLSLIDISLAGNLVLIIIIAGYENFVSTLDIDDSKDKLEWRASTDFATLKLKLVASIIAISAINLLRVFMAIGQVSEQEIKWMVIIHVVFLFSGLLLALMDSIAAKTKMMRHDKNGGMHV